MNRILKIWKLVFLNWKYVFLLIIASFVFYILNGLVINVVNIGPVYGLLGFFGAAEFLFASSLNFIREVNLVSSIGIIILSLLVGMLICLLFYRFYKIDKSDREKIGFVAGLGIFLGAAAPGCAACGVGLISVVGLSSALIALPFMGQEIIIGAIILVGFSVVNVSRKLYNSTCKLESMEIQKMKGGINGRKQK